MRRAELDLRLGILRSRVEPLERFIHAFEGSLHKPLFYDSGKQHFGFRYGKPDMRHFCLLKGIRAVSALNAAVELVRTGYTQEFFVLLRTITEYRTHIEFILSARDKNGKLRADAEKHVKEYFADFARNSPADFKRPQLRQGVIHDSVGAMLSGGVQGTARAAEFEKTVPAKLMSNVYLNFSNYVHARYPEVMDLYGGTPPRFHLRGMSETPKDTENIEMLDSEITSVSLTLKLLVQKLEMNGLIMQDTILAAWYPE